MIPREMVNPRAVALLVEYLREEINRALSDRAPLEEKWMRYQRIYKGVPEQAVKTFPFYGAANLVLPIAATDVDTVYSRLAGVLFGPDNVWSCRALRDDAMDYAPRLQEFLQWAQHAELGAYAAIADWLLELTKLGTAVLKQRYRREQKLVYEFRETPGQTLERLQRVLLKDSPVLEHVSLYDFLVPAGTTDHQTAPWNAERVMLSPQQYEARVRAGVYTPAPQLLQNHDQGSWLTHEAQRAQGFAPSLRRGIELWEIWVDFDLGFGEPMPLVAGLHLPTMTLARLDFNPFFHQEKPFSVARYLRQEKQFYGIGICEMDEMVQHEATAMHNQRLDSGTLANSTMLKARKNAGIKEDDPIFPGRIWLVNEMDDIGPLQMGRQFDSSTNDEQFTLSYAQRRTGVNDVVMGNPSAATGYAAAQTNILTHQEAAKRFDQTLREVRVALSDAGRRCVELYQQFDTRGKEFQVLGQRDGALVNAVLQFPLELIRHSVEVTTTATSASLNKETQIRTNTILMQMVTQFYQQMFQLMSLVVNPQLPPPLKFLAEQAVLGGATMMRRVLDSYDMQDADKIIPDMSAVLQSQQAQMQGMGFPVSPLDQRIAGGQLIGGPAQPAMGPPLLAA